MIVNIRITPWSTETGVKHVASSWQISTTADFTNIIIDNPETKVDVTSFSPDLIIPKNTVFYVRVKRHFNDKSTTDWIPIKTITNSETDYGVDVQDDLYINSPTIMVNEEELHDKDKDTFNIKLSKYDPNIIDKHHSTHWIITDSFNNVLFSSIDNKSNLDSLDINKASIDLYNRNMVYVQAIYKSETGVESGVTTIPVLILDVSFDVTVNLKSVPAYKDLYVNIKATDADKPLQEYIKIILSDVDDNPIDVVFNNSATFTYVNGKLLKSGQTYKLKIFPYRDNDDIYREYYLEVSNELFCSLYTGYKYTDNITILKDTDIGSSRFNSIQLPDGQILVPKEDGKMYRYNYISKALRAVTEVTDIDISNIKRDSFTNIRLLPNKKLIIDYTNKDNKKVFDIYDFVEATNTFNNKQTVVRATEPFLDLYTSYINVISDKDVLYMTQDRNVKIIDTETKAIDTLQPIPTDAVNLSFISTCKGDILAMWGNKTDDLTKRSFNDIYKYNIVKKSWIKYDTIPTDVSDKFNLGQVRLMKDGKFIIFNASSDENKAKDSSTIIYDWENKKWTTTTNNPDFTTSYQSVIELIGGGFIRLSNDNKAYYYN